MHDGIIHTIADDQTCEGRVITDLSYIGMDKGILKAIIYQERAAYYIERDECMLLRRLHVDIAGDGMNCGKRPLASMRLLWRKYHQRQ
jgi:hypothetical protein